jgi:hypothetical protein
MQSLKIIFVEVDNLANNMLFEHVFRQLSDDSDTDDSINPIDLNNTISPSIMPSAAPSASYDGLFLDIPQYILVFIILFIVVLTAVVATVRTAKISVKQGEFMIPNAANDIPKEARQECEYYQVSETDFLIADED